MLVSSYEFNLLVTGTQEFAVDDVVAAEQIVDPFGKGDAFAGGFLAEFALGKDIETCVRAGQYMSKYVMKGWGVSFEKPCEYLNVI